MCFTTIFKADNNLLNVILERASMLIKIAYKFDASDFSPYIYNNTYLSIFSQFNFSSILITTLLYSILQITPQIRYYFGFQIISIYNESGLFIRCIALSAFSITVMPIILHSSTIYIFNKLLAEACHLERCDDLLINAQTFNLTLQQLDSIT